MISGQEANAVSHGASNMCALIACTVVGLGFNQPCIGFS